MTAAEKLPSAETVHYYGYGRGYFGYGRKYYGRGYYGARLLRPRLSLLLIAKAPLWP